MKLLLVTFIAILLASDVTFSGLLNNAPTRSCTNLFQCLPYLFSIRFKDIVNTVHYYTGSLLKLSQISDTEWNFHMDTFSSICDIYENFDSCMDKDWIECLDWNQLANMVDVVGAVGDQATDSVNNTALRQGRMNRTHQGLKDVGWTVDDTRKAMKVVSHLCKNIHNFIPYLSCMRDLMLSNETIINVTIWYTNGLLRQPDRCAQAPMTCSKVEKVSKMMGHWLYHGCSHGVEVLTDVVRAIFEGMTFTDSSDCNYIFTGKTAAEIYEPMYDKQTERDWGNDVSKCDFVQVQRDLDGTYNEFVRTYFEREHLTREEFYHKMACKQRHLNLSECDYWPYPTTKPGPTTTQSTTPSTTSTTTTTPEPVTTKAVRNPSAGRPVVAQPRPVAQRPTPETNLDDNDSEEVSTTVRPTRRLRGRTTSTRQKKVADEGRGNKASAITTASNKRLFTFLSLVLFRMFFL